MFGTDGIRGFSFKEPLTKTTIFKIGYSFATYLKKSSSISNIFIAKDTRKSSDYIRKNITEGINCAGISVINLNILPTASISIFTNKYPDSAGLMITASHNNYKYNGIKFFNSLGEKLSRKDENEIVKVFNSTSYKKLKKPKNVNYNSSLKEYVDEIIKRVDFSFSLKEKFAIDLSNGASYKATPMILKKLRINAKMISISPQGLNINRNCGVEYIKKISTYVKKNNLSFGVAIDGDADRIIFVDKDGKFIEGDKVIYFLAKSLLRKNEPLVTTIMSNNILETKLKNNFKSIIRTEVGDKNVYSKMKEVDTSFGCENSGHYIFKDYLNTSDSNLTLLLILSLIEQKKFQFDSISKIQLNPSALKSYEVNQKKPLKSIKELQLFIQKFNNKYKKNSYINVRYSGTENKIRILIQHPKEEVIEEQLLIFEQILNEINK